MPVKKHFVNRGLQNTLIEEYLASELDNSGYAGCSLQKTPMGTRITIRTSRPGIVIGRRGAKVKELTESVKEKFDINVPTIDVETVENPELNAQIQAERIAYAIQKGQNYRRATYSIIRRIMRSGARGIEVHISGKVTSQRARQQVFRAGVISKCGFPAEVGVSRGVCHLTLKSGVLGIRVKIMPESYQLPDEVKILEGIFDRETEEKKPDEGVDPFYQDELPEEPEEPEDIFEDTSDAEEKSVTISEDIEVVDEEEDLIDDIVEEEDEIPDIDVDLDL
ncbi:MAG: 30S ribosomal protein S3 [Promethearchaeota archaeon]